jgi:alkanesulfonate monooxygenase SsuD/methylene tetrahydromethanopterin reductase-like flavin-dependent oxidoreductase (luciferase family)
LKIDIQYSPGTNDWPVLRDAVLRAEADGYDSTWVFDHFDGTMVQGDRPMLECFTLLGALADATTTIGLGTLVANVANRHPAVLAAAASSVQRISGGRFTLGLGAGTSPGSKWSSEHVVRGIPLQAGIDDRHLAVIEQIAAIRDLPEAMNVIADGINVRMSNDRAAEFVKAAREAAANRPFEVSGWSFGDVDGARGRAEELELDRLVITVLEPLA